MGNYPLLFGKVTQYKDFILGKFSTVFNQGRVCGRLWGEGKIFSRRNVKKQY